MDIYAKLTANMPLGEEEHDRLNRFTSKALPAFTADMPEQPAEGERSED